MLKDVREKLNMLGEVCLSLPCITDLIYLSLWHCLIFIVECFVLLSMQHWTRDERNKSLKEAAKSFKFLGQIVRLIIV